MEGEAEVPVQTSWYMSYLISMIFQMADFLKTLFMALFSEQDYKNVFFNL